MRTLSIISAAGGLLVAASGAAAGPGPAPAPAVVAQAAAATQAARKAYAFDLTVESAGQVWKARFDPGAAPHLRLVEPASLAGDAQTGFNNTAKTLEGVRWCASPELVRAPMRLVRQDEASATYAFQPSAEMMTGAKDPKSAAAMAAHLQGQFTVAKQAPDVTQMSMTLTQPFSPAPLVHVDRFDLSIRCAPAPNGRRYAAETTTDIKGTMLGRAIDRHSVQRTSGLMAR